MPYSATFDIGGFDDCLYTCLSFQCAQEALTDFAKFHPPNVLVEQLTPNFTLPKVCIRI